MESFFAYFLEATNSKLKFGHTEVEGIKYQTVNGVPYMTRTHAGREEARTDVYLRVDGAWKLIDGDILSGRHEEEEIDEAFVRYFKSHPPTTEQDEENLNMTLAQNKDEEDQQSSQNPQAPAAGTTATPAQPTGAVNPAVQPTNSAIVNNSDFKAGTTNIGGKSYDTVNNIPLQVQNQGGKKNAYLLLNNQWTLVSPNAQTDMQVQSDLKDYFKKQVPRTS